MTREIPLTKGKVALVDDDVYNMLTQFNWRAHRSTSGKDLWYAVRATKHTMLMHRCIVDFDRVDHKNGDGLDNRRINLRSATGSQNIANTKKGLGTSKYKGVSWHARDNCWYANIRVNYKRKHLGLFKNEIEAALAYDDAAREYFGEFATFNFPRESERSALG